MQDIEDKTSVVWRGTFYLHVFRVFRYKTLFNLVSFYVKMVQMRMHNVFCHEIIQT